MVVRIRLARFGKRNNPFYNIVVAHARYSHLASHNDCTLIWTCRTARNSKPLEVLGTYNPVATQPEDPKQKPFKDVKMDVSRAKYWIGVGAQPSDSAWKLLNMVCLASWSGIAHYQTHIRKFTYRRGGSGIAGAHENDSPD
jgi:small subunit ribosomal protein S16